MKQPTMKAILQATNWQAHSVRGFLAAIWANCASVCVRGLRAYGISLSRGHNPMYFAICISSIELQVLYKTRRNQSSIEGLLLRNRL
jgi:hypothetical protein